MATKRSGPKKLGRLHIRVEASLATSMHDYAHRHHTDLSAIVTEYFLRLLATEEASKFPEAEQI